MSIDTLDRMPHLPSRVADAIRREIDDGRLKPGDRLPGEQALAAKFGVSRNVVREAIARLRTDGVVHSRQGVGAFVVRRGSPSILRLDLEALSDRGLFGNVFELRAMLEIKAARLAAQRGDPRRWLAITQALERMRGVEKWAEGGVDADLDFHRAVALATGNNFVAKVLSFVSEHMRESIMATRQRPSADIGQIIEITIAEHAAIHDAILSGSPQAAETAMRRHIVNAARRLGFELPVDA